MSQVSGALIDRARAWAADDPDPATRMVLAALIDAAQQGNDKAASELTDAFNGTLEFGTAGLRGAMGPGPNRMNMSVVSRAAAGIGTYLTNKVGPSRVVIGYDARYNSKDFAEASAAILTAAGHDVTLMPEAWPTPVLAFAVRQFDAECGIMVTASHNPARDNGYKVYLGGRATGADGNGVQIVPPADHEIAACIQAVGAVRDIPRAEHGFALAGRDLLDSYLAKILPVVDTTQGEEPKDLRIVHTAMHGVGHGVMMEAFARASFTRVHSVAEQAEPDPAFPTVPFPNPEEKGAIDLAVKLAEQVEADLVIANDPDADRCAAAIFDTRVNAWRMLHGDEFGLLLATYLLRHRNARGTFANSIVSSRALGKLASRAGVASEQTLTGFKWIARTPGIVFGYEEAIGYCVLPEVVKDKDGISAALAIAQLAAIQKAAGSSLLDLLDDLARELGLHLSDQVSIRVEQLSQIDQMMERLRSEPPHTIAGSPVSVHDLAHGSVEKTGLPPTNGIMLLADDSSRIIVRPSGTEPKLKAYLEVIEPVPADASFDQVTKAREAARSKLETLATEIRAALGA